MSLVTTEPVETVETLTVELQVMALVIRELVVCTRPCSVLYARFRVFMVLAVAVLVTRRVAVLARLVESSWPVVVDMARASMLPLSEVRTLPGFPVRAWKLMVTTLRVPAEADMASMVIEVGALVEDGMRVKDACAVVVDANPGSPSRRELYDAVLRSRDS